MTHLHKGHGLPMVDLPWIIHHPEISNRFVTGAQSLECVPKCWSRDHFQFQETEWVQATKLGDVSTSTSSDGTGYTPNYLVCLGIGGRLMKESWTWLDSPPSPRVGEMKYVEAGYSQHAQDQGHLGLGAGLKEEELWTDEEWDKSPRFAQRIGSTQPETKAGYG